MTNDQPFNIDVFAHGHGFEKISDKYRAGIVFQRALDTGLPEAIQASLDDVMMSHPTSVRSS